MTAEGRPRALAALVALLDEEHAALLAGDEARIALAAARKTELVRAIAHAAPEAAGGAELARAAARKNARNGMLIGARLADVERRLAFFRAALGAPAPLYGPDGLARGR